MRTAPALRIEDIAPGDLEQVGALDALRGGEARVSWWRRLFGEYVAGGEDHVALAARDAKGALVGQLFGEVRTWEFGSERCGWIFSVAVAPAAERQGVATGLCQEAGRRFAARGVTLVRTMVRRGDVPLLALFRSLGYGAGPFTELERTLPRAPAQREGAA